MTRSTILQAPAADVWDLLQRSDTLVHIADGVMRYDGADELPEQWSVGTKANLRPVLFGRFPAGDHFVEFTRIDHSSLEMETAESGGSITRWDHHMAVVPLEDGRCRYVDTVEIEAGWQTFGVWAFARFFYGHRHRRWRLLLAEKTTTQ